MDAYKLLKEICEHESCEPIPFIVFNCQHDESIIANLYELDAKAVLSKLQSSAKLFEELHTVLEFWLGVAHSLSYGE